jgi:hypothetical protein
MRLLLLTVLLTLSLNLSASCLTVQRDTKATMDARQRGVDINVVIEIAKEKSMSEDIFGAYFRMILRAYSVPQFDNKESRDKASKDFSLEYYSRCHEVSA